MRPLMRFAFAPIVFLVLATAATAADDFAVAPVFAFSPQPPDPNKDVDVVPVSYTPKGWTVDPTVRPNHGGKFYLYVRNPGKGDEKKLIVEVSGGPDSRLQIRKEVTVPAGKWVPVELPPVEPPKAPPAEQPKAPPQPGAAPVPPPPGTELTATPTGHYFTIRLLDQNGKAVTIAEGNDQKPAGRNVLVKIQAPSEYVSVEHPPVVVRGGVFAVRSFAVTATVSPILINNGQPAFDGVATTTLGFTPQSPAQRAVIRSGQYLRTLEIKPGLTMLKAETAPRVTLTGAIQNPAPDTQVYVGVDGIDRAFVYTLGEAVEGGGRRLSPQNDIAVRLYPGAGFRTGIDTQPVPAYPVRIDTDNALGGGTLELWVRPVRPGAPDIADDKPENYEVVSVGRPRDERVFVDTAGPGGSILISSRSKDWVKGLDLSALRGPHEVFAAVRVEGAAKPVISAPLMLNVDATGPVRIEFGKLPTRHPKGKPLPVSATAGENETRVVKAVFFLGEPTEDGKIPPGAPTVEGVRSVKDPAVWVAALPLPPDTQGAVFVGVQFTNNVGVSSTDVQTVVLVDEKSGGAGVGPLGSIEATVVFGELPQPGVAVSLRNAEGKVVGAGSTNDKGKVKFEKLAPGLYTLVATKADSSYGKAGVAQAEVVPFTPPADKPDELPKPTKVTVPLSKKTK